MVNRLRYTRRKDGYTISTVEPKCLAWYGKYETAIILDGVFEWRIAEGYETELEALEGHEKYSSMTKEEIEKIAWIG